MPDIHENVPMGQRSVSQLLDDGYLYYCNLCGEAYRDVPDSCCCNPMRICYTRTGELTNATTQSSD